MALLMERLPSPLGSIFNPHFVRYSLLPDMYGNVGSAGKISQVLSLRFPIGSGKLIAVTLGFTLNLNSLLRTQFFLPQAKRTLSQHPKLAAGTDYVLTYHALSLLVDRKILEKYKHVVRFLTM